MYTQCTELLPILQHFVTLEPLPKKRGERVESRETWLQMSQTRLVLMLWLACSGLSASNEGIGQDKEILGKEETPFDLGHDVRVGSGRALCPKWRRRISGRGRKEVKGKTERE